MTNAEIAYHFEQVACLLTEQQANLYRIHAYRRAADTLRNLDRPVTRYWREFGTLNPYADYYRTASCMGAAARRN